MGKARTIRSPATRRPHGVRYPWRVWIAAAIANGGITLTRGVDFHCEPAGFGITARVMGNRLGTPVTAKVNGNQVELTRRK